MNKADLPFAGIVVVELGIRISASICSSLLAQLGATVFYVEWANSTDREGKSAYRALSAVGKQSIVADLDRPSDAAALRDLLNGCDVVVTSSDVDPASVTALVDGVNGAIKCDVSAFGKGDPPAGLPLSEMSVQAVAGILDTTGPSDQSPTASKIPIVEVSSGIWAAAGVVAALRVRRNSGHAQNVQVAMYDCAFTMLATFLPKYFAGQKSERIGNRHPSIAPWNCYRTSDGWAQVCTGTAEQWTRLADVIGYDHSADSLKFNTLPQRMERVELLDRLVESWTQSRSTNEVVDRLSAAGIPCGPVSTIEELMTDENLRHRRMVLGAKDPVTGRSVKIPGNVFGAWLQTTGSSSIPKRDAGRSVLAGLALQTRSASPPKPAEAPLVGVRVIELGLWTTAPLASRLLASLGADVVKIEPPPSGDPARMSAPFANGESYLFNLNNAQKECVDIDLRTEEGKRSFEQMISRCDVFIENLKPGSLGKLGYPFEALARLNSQIIYCAISGFGAHSTYAGRPAMDTVLQAMCGVMHLTQKDGVPFKFGVSISDLMGGYFGFLATIAALETRDKGLGRAQFLDLSMQDMTAWATQHSWNDIAQDCAVKECADGFIVVEGQIPPILLERFHELTRQECVAVLQERRIRAAPILSVNEVAASRRTQERGLVCKSSDRSSAELPLLAVPIRLEKTPPVVSRPPRKLRDGVRAVIERWPPRNEK